MHLQFIFFFFTTLVVKNMPQNNTDTFYTNLPINELSLPNLLADAALFFKVPENWVVIITDVKNSTKAAAAGLQQTINLVATGSIVAVLNLAHKRDLMVPFFFGGDGATFIIPPLLFDTVLVALQQHQSNVLQNFGLHLRVGHVSMTEIYQNEKTLLISKIRASPLLFIPVLLGDGLQFAETKIKSTAYSPLSIAVDEMSELDMYGMQCRWDKIPPPGDDKEIISLLVIAANAEKQATVFATVMQTINEVYGSERQRHPISIQKLQLLATLKKIRDEMRARFRNQKWGYLLKTWATTFIGKLYFKTKKGKVYLDKLVDLSDTLVIDGKINTVITGNTAQRKQLIKALDILEKNKAIFYGLHISKASIMSCYVRNMDNDHIHFVDGDDGGYTKAAIMLKEKIKAASH
jgi:hypothetical protein